MECAGQSQQRERRTPPPPRPPAPGTVRASREGENHEATAAFRSFQKLHDKAFAAAHKALNADEEEDKEAAEGHYSACARLLDELLTVDCEHLPGLTSSERDNAKQMQQKANKTKLQVTYRLESLRAGDEVPTNPGLVGPEEMPVRLPSYDEAVSSSGHSSLVSDAALGDSIMNAEYPSALSTQRRSMEGTELFSVAEGVQIFYITAEGYVSAPSYPSSLHIVKLEEGSTQSHTPSAFIHVGDWFYPLIPGASPVLHTNYGAYLFPDLNHEATGSSVGLILPEGLSEAEKHTMEDILRNLSAVQEQQTYSHSQEVAGEAAVPSAPLEERAITPQADLEAREGEREGEKSATDQTTSAKISRGIVVASKWISWGVGKGAEKAGELISYGSIKLREKIHPEAEAKPIDPRVQKGMVYARKATHTAVSVSAFIVTKLGEATMALGRQVAPHIRRKGSELLPKSMKTGENKSTFDGVVEVAASGLKGFGTVYLSLEGAAKALARSMANETVSTVRHKYGEHAGKLTENTVYAAGNLALTAYNVDNLGIKAIAKRAAKDAGKAVLEDVSEGKNGDNQKGSAVNGASPYDKDGKGYGGEKKK